MKNKASMTVKFMNFEQLNSETNFLTTLQENIYAMKHNILENPSEASDLSYYALQNKIQDALLSGETEYHDDVYVSDVNYDLFERFSKEYGMSFNLHVAKFGPHIDDCTDETSLNYYNMTDTFIDNGRMMKQMYLHVNTDSIPVDEHMITLFNDDCVHTLLSAKTVLQDRLPEKQNIDTRELANVDKTKVVDEQMNI